MSYKVRNNNQAINELKERTASSPIVIMKHMQEETAADKKWLSGPIYQMFFKVVKEEVESGVLIKGKESKKKRKKAAAMMKMTTKKEAAFKPMKEQTTNKKMTVSISLRL